MQPAYTDEYLKSVGAFESKENAKKSAEIIEEYFKQGITVKATIIEIVQDNCQGASGKITENEVLVELANNTKLCEIIDIVHNKALDNSMNKKFWGMKQNYLVIKKIELMNLI